MGSQRRQDLLRTPLRGRLSSWTPAWSLPFFILSCLADSFTSAARRSWQLGTELFIQQGMLILMLRKKKKRKEEEGEGKKLVLCLGFGFFITVSNFFFLISIPLV